MNILFGLPGPHDVLFAAPLRGALPIGVPLGFSAFRPLDPIVGRPEDRD